MNYKLLTFAALAAMPTVAAGGCKAIKLDTKCNMGKNRLFRKDFDSVEDCAKECKKADGCNYFSYQGHKNLAHYGGKWCYWRQPSFGCALLSCA